MTVRPRPQSPCSSRRDPVRWHLRPIPVAHDDYDAILRASGQHVGDAPGRIDTVFDHAYPERAFADHSYVGVLLEQRIVDDAFVADVLMVDFTRPIFSDDRCGLLAFAPDLPGDALSPDAVRDGFVARLEAADPAAGSPAAQLLAHLRQADDRHDQTAAAFLAACEARAGERVTLGAGTPAARSVAASAVDLMRITSLQRDQARALPAFGEFPETMPDDDLSVAPGSRLHPVTCEITTGFVAPARPSAP